MKLSLVIPAKDKNDPKLNELLLSIKAQDFPKEEMEVLVITEGTSESAKAIGIRKAKGEVIGILASDNELVDKNTLWNGYTYASEHGASYPAFYYLSSKDDVLNRYFALIGGNDPLSYYMGKNDKFSYFGIGKLCQRPTLGDNGFFIKKSLIEQTDLDNYYHIDNAVEATENCDTKVFTHKIWHKTGGNIFKFFAKRYRYGLQHAFNKNRRWHLVDFSKPIDVWRLVCFIVMSLTVIQPMSLSIRGYLKIRDKAWFLHPIVCLMTLGTYSLLILNLGIRTISQKLQSLFAPSIGRTA